MCGRIQQIVLPFVVGGLLWVGQSLEVKGADWPQWRGPNRDGRIVEPVAAVGWPKEWQKVWQVEVGEGHSSPVAVGQVVYQFARQGDDEVLRALSLADGRPLWSDRYPAPYEMNPAARDHGKGPKSTPVVGQGRIVTLGISGILTCWDTTTGKRLWQQEFSGRFARTSPLYGTSMSPIVDGDCVIAHVGGHDQGALTAFDLNTGKILWQWDEDGPAYTSPIIAELAGVRQLITQSQQFCIGVDPKTGKLLWKIPFTTQYDMNIVTPVVWRDLILFSGYRRGTTAYRLENSPEGLKPNRVWHADRVSMFMSSPVLSGELLVGFAQEARGQYVSLDPETGKVLWASDGRQGENAALLVGGNHIFSLVTTGEFSVFELKENRLVPQARWKVAESPTWAHPVLCAEGLLVKDRQLLTLWKP